MFGNSSGAVIGLDLAARYPGHVRALVAHEPVVFELLDDRDHWRALMEEVHKIFVNDGAGPAMQRLGEALGMGDDGGGQQEPSPEMARMAGNMDTFVGYETRSFGRYTPDLAALRTGSPLIVVGGGVLSAGQPPYRAALELAGRLGVAPVGFPGGHGGFGDHAEEFAARLHTTL